MSDAQGMEQFFRERGFGQLIGWGDSPALLVIDFTRAFTNPALPLGSNLDRELAETVRVLGAAREAAIPIYYSSVCYEDKDLRDAGLWAKKIAGTMTLRAGTPEVEIDPRLGRRADEAIIVKKYGSVFFGTDLLTRLNTVDHIIENEQWMSDLVELLAPFDVFFVGVHCPLPELERRERHRGDRRIGEARTDFHVVHRFTAYDFDIDSTQPNEGNVEMLIMAWQSRSHPTAFERMATRR